MGQKWVKSTLSFRYDLDVDASKGCTLQCTYAGGDKECAFDILVDGLLLAQQSSTGGKDGEFVDARYRIPEELIRGKKKVSVMFRARGGKPTTELFGCEIVDGRN
jgi:hypothetical protein